MRPPTVMIVGKRGGLPGRVQQLFADGDINTVTVDGYRQTVTMVSRERPSVVLCIVTDRSAETSIKIIAAIREMDPQLPVILVTDHGSESLAVAALRVGVSDYYRHPFSDRELLARCRQMMPPHPFRRMAPAGGGEAGIEMEQAIIGDSSAMCALKRYIQRVAQTDSTVLITGETGTGKELAAEWIHKQSRRRRKPLIRVNCSAMPEGLVESELFGYERGAFTGAVETRRGKFEIAGSGSLLLDEIAEMRPYAQAKLLRCIEDRTIYPLGARRAVSFDSRVIAATNKDPEALISDGKFREDLYYRLNVARLHIPPLRERREDIPALIKCGIRKLNKKFSRRVEGLKEDVLPLLMRYDWPGNVRELMNMLEGAFINLPARRITQADLPLHFKNKLMQSQHLPSDERKRILTALLETNWNKSETAKKLSWSRPTVYRKMHQYNIVEKRKRPQ